MDVPFIGRRTELHALETEYTRGPGVITVTGRTGIGKTRLLREFSVGKSVLHFTASPVNDRMLLDEFDRRLSEFCGSRPGSCRSWSDAFRTFASHSDNLKILILDGFQYLASEGFLTELRDSWDEVLSEKNVIMILCGSVVSQMRSLTADQDSPMFGIVRKEIVLEPLRFEEIASDDYTGSLTAYSMHGGIPAVMRHTRNITDPEELFSVLSDPDSGVFSRVIDSLSAEVKGLPVYLSIMKAIAEGRNRITQISDAVGIPPTTLNAYLRKLLDNGAVRRTVPATEYFPEKSKSGIYSIADYNTLFWLSFIHPHLSQMEAGDDAQAKNDFSSRFEDILLHPAYREACISALQFLTDEIGFMPIMFGRFWNKNVDMDIIALNPAKRRALIARCYCGRGKATRDDLNALIRDAEHITELRGYVVKPGMFSLNGFEEDLMAEPNLLLVHGRSVVNGKRSEGVLDGDTGI